MHLISKMFPLKMPKLSQSMYENNFLFLCAVLLLQETGRFLLHLKHYNNLESWHRKLKTGQVSAVETRRGDQDWFQRRNFKKLRLNVSRCALLNWFWCSQPVFHCILNGGNTWKKICSQCTPKNKSTSCE